MHLHHCPYRSCHKYVNEVNRSVDVSCCQNKGKVATDPVIFVLLGIDVVDLADSETDSFSSSSLPTKSTTVSALYPFSSHNHPKNWHPIAAQQPKSKYPSVFVFSVSKRTWALFTYLSAVMTCTRVHCFLWIVNVLSNTFTAKLVFLAFTILHLLKRKLPRGSSLPSPHPRRPIHYIFWRLRDWNGILLPILC